MSEVITIDNSNEAAKKTHDFVDNTDMAELDEFFDEAVEIVSDKYDETGNPLETYRFFNGFELNEHQPERAAYLAVKEHKVVLSLGRLYEIVAYLLINSGKDALIHDARNYLSTSLDIYNAIAKDNDSAELCSHIVYTKWLIAITYKQQGNFDEAHHILTDALSYAENVQTKYDMSYADTVLIPRRELAIIDNDESGFDKLVDDEKLYADNAKEHFFTLRRCFEAYCLNSNVDKANSIKSKLDESYRAVANKLEPVYAYAMKIDEFFYDIATGKVNEADKLYNAVYSELVEKNFVKYADILKRAYNDVKNDKKITFMIHDC